MSAQQASSSLQLQSHLSMGSFILAVSAKWFHSLDRFRWIAKQGFALEYTPNPDDLKVIPNHLDPFLDVGVRVRHHGFFPGYELGNTHTEQAEHALRVHREALNAIHGRGEQVITVHVGLTKDVQIDPESVVKHLACLVEYGRNLGITVSLENLKQGLTSHPENVVEWARKTDAKITLDVGHAISCERVQNGELTVHDFIDLFEDRLIEIHMYEKELDRHYAPQDMTILGPIVDRLVETDCCWWTIELVEYADILQTRNLLKEYLMVLKSGIPKPE